VIKTGRKSVKTNRFPPITILTFADLAIESTRVSAQAKPISEVVKDFEQSLRSYRPSTRRVYVAGERSSSIGPITPEKIRAAFLRGDPFSEETGSVQGLPEGSAPL
jgi:hypothetical protein